LHLNIIFNKEKMEIEALVTLIISNLYEMSIQSILLKELMSPHLLGANKK